MADASVKWYGREVLQLVGKFEGLLLKEIAFQVEGHAKVNIVSNNQVDTGFMLNSTYTVAPGKDTYALAKVAAEARNPKAVMAPRQQPPDKETAVVAVGAAYAVFNERRKSFLYLAAEQTAKDVNGLVQIAGKNAGFR